MIEWDENKRLSNLRDHGVDFSAAYRLDHETALVRLDTRFDYKEARYQALGLIDGRLHMLVYTIRSENRRIISLRKANKREIKLYEQFREA